MRTKSFLLSGLCLTLTIGAARAQMPNASQQVDMVQQRRQLEAASPLPAATNAVPELYEGESGDVGPQSVLQIKHRRTFVEGSADEQYFFSDNVFLANHGKKSADVLVSTASAALAPTPYAFAGGLLSPRVGYQQQWFNYGLASSGIVHVYDPRQNPATYYSRISKFDFNASTVFTDVAWRRQNWTFTLGGDYRRLLDSGNYDEFYHEFVPRWSVGRAFSINESLSLFAAYEGDYHLTESTPPGTPNPTSPVYPSTFNDRTDQGLVLAGSWRLCRYAMMQPFYRFQFTHYTSINRDDFLNSFGLALSCPITRQITLRTFVSYDMANTDGFYVQNYRSLNAGGGLNLTVRF